MGLSSFARKLVPSRNIMKSATFKNIFVFSFPEKFKGTFIEKWANFWKNIMADYAEVVKETSKDIKERPKRALAYTWGGAVVWYCVHTKPNALSFRDQVLSSSLELSSIPDSVRSKASSKHLIFLESCYNDGTIRCLNLGVLNVMWVDNYDKTVGLYPAQCKYLEPKLLTFHNRIVDVGFLGRWWIISRKMKDCDVNQDEWESSLDR